jgi:hypothetical protein
MTNSVNTSLDFAEKLFKELVWDNLIKIGLLALFADAPVFAIWPLRQIVTTLVSVLSEKLFSALKTVTDVTAIPLINSQHQRAFDAASVKLKIIAHDKGIDSDEFKKAREDAKVALAQFVRFSA